MKDISNIEFHTGSKEERLPDFSPHFPYIASRTDLNNHIERFVPWHWHKAVELFYIESGMLEYCTPAGKMTFPAGSGGMVNSNVLHMTRAKTETKKNIQILHIFDPSFIAGEQGSRIEQEYVIPIIAAPQIEIIQLRPEYSKEAKILDLIRDSFQLSGKDIGYEIKLREALSEIWLQLFIHTCSIREEKQEYGKSNDKIKMMMIYIHEHYAEKISVTELAAAAFISERECFRIFRDCLHMSPVEYMKGYRLQMACQMLAKSQDPVTSISHACGLGSSSYFGKLFREEVGCTPLEYRQKWQDSDTS